jgi:serine protease Do
VLAIGAPFGLDYTLTAGVLSAKGRGGLGANEIEDYLQTDASINPGNSGGPLVDLRGRVLGINTMIIGRASGIGFAIPSNLARSVGDQLLASGKVRRAWLGVSFQELSQELAQSLGKRDTHGALVAAVVPKGPADQAGLRPGDIIESVDADKIMESKDLLRSVLQKPVGAQVKLGVLRDGKSQTLSVKTALRPQHGDEVSIGGDAAPTQAELGMQLQPLTPEIAQQLGYRGVGKVVVAGVRLGSAAESAGLERGDVIVEADRQVVQTPDDVARAAADGQALLRVERGDGHAFFVVLNKAAD